MLSPASKLLAQVVVLASTLAVGAQAKAAPPTLAQLAASKLGLSCSNVTLRQRLVREVLRKDPELRRHRPRHRLSIPLDARGPLRLS